MTTGAGASDAPLVSGADLDRMSDRLFLEGRRKQSAFWVLLTLAAIIAGAGVVEDSDATVIGAMIVAPLMTPILGTALAVVLADRARIVRGVATVVLGAALVVALGFLLGLLVPEPVVADDLGVPPGRGTRYGQPREHFPARRSSRPTVPRHRK